MGFHIISQSSLNDTDCLGYALRDDSRHYIWRPESNEPPSDGAMLRYLQELGLRHWWTDNPMFELRYARRRVEEVAGFRIADRPGRWNADSFALPDGEVFCPPSETPAVAAFEPREHAFPKAGSAASWTKFVATMALDHPVLLASLAMGFAAPLKGLVGEYEPLALQLCGERGSHVELAGALLSSLFEVPCPRDAIYSMTCSALLDAHDDATVYGGLAAVVRGSNLHMAGLSTAQRINAAKEIIEAIDAGGAVLLLDRVSVAAAIQGDERVSAELNERLMTISFPINSGDVFGRLPDGNTSSTEYARLLQEAAAANAGQAGRDYLAKLVSARANDETGLRAFLAKKVRLFVRHAKVESGDHRGEVGRRKFALLYAGLSLAAEYGIVPRANAKGEKVHFGKSLLGVFYLWRTADAPPSSLITVLESIAAAPSTPTVDDRAGYKRRDLSADTKAFVIVKVGCRELIIQVDAIEEFIPDWWAREGGTEAMTYLRRERGHTRLQRQLAGGGRKRVYCFELPLMPLGEKN